MDSHRAALWCWLQHCDKHTDTLQSRLGEWVAAFLNLEDITIDEYINIAMLPAIWWFRS